MTKVPFFHLIVIAIMLNGCTAIVKSLYGVKDPDFVNHDQILNFQESIGFKNVPYYGVKMELWKKGIIFPVPDVLVFDAQGRFIPYKDSLRPNCNGPAEVFLSELNASRQYIYSDSLTLNKLIQMTEGPRCAKPEFDYLSNADFYIFMTYATFMGKKLNREKTIVWLDSLKNNHNIRYQLFMLNQDLKDCWSDEQKLWFGKMK